MYIASLITSSAGKAVKATRIGFRAEATHAEYRTTADTPNRARFDALRLTEKAGHSVRPLNALYLGEWTGLTFQGSFRVGKVTNFT